MSVTEILDEDRALGSDGLYRKVKTTTVVEEVASLRVVPGPEGIELVYVEGRGPFTAVQMTPQEARHVAGLLLAAAGRGGLSDG